jgi:hypothetical protein
MQYNLGAMYREGPAVATQQRPTVVCAWCFRVLERGGTLISHGICDDCVARLMQELASGDSEPGATVLAIAALA